MQQTVGGIINIFMHYNHYTLLQAFEESWKTAMLNEWERTCLPPQNEEVIIIIMGINRLHKHFTSDDSCFLRTLEYALVRDD